MVNIRYIVYIVAAASATGCDSLGPGPAQSVGDLPPSAPRSVGGQWVGDLDLDGVSSSTHRIEVFLTEDLRFRTLQFGPSSMLRGSFGLKGRLISGEGIALASPGETWSNGESATAFSISGTLDQPTMESVGKLLVSVSMASGDTGRLYAESPYENYWPTGGPYPLRHVVGTWRASQDEAGNGYRWMTQPEQPAGFVTIEVVSDGTFFGSDSDGCEVAGALSTIDERYQLWSVDYRISDCDRGGSYSGLMLVTQDAWFTYLNFSVDDGVRSQALQFLRQ